VSVCSLLAHLHREEDGDRNTPAKGTDVELSDIKTEKSLKILNAAIHGGEK
jgi:hypothetical protein